jgi:imidazolonepropionase-like amidohydrolase
VYALVVRAFIRASLLAVLLCAAKLQPADVVLIGGTVYPSPEAPPIVDAAIVIRDHRIASVGTHRAIKVPHGSQTIDCSGKFVVAGLWNCHIHIITPGLLHARDADASDLSRQLDAMLNRWGFTTVFDLASVLDNTVALRRRIDSGEVRGPHILTAGEPLWTVPPIYVRDYLIANHIDIPVVTTPADAAARVQAEAQRGVNGIKLFTGSVQDGRVANMPLDMVRSAVNAAHSLRLPVFTHPQNSTGLETAIAGGVDILAHTVPGSPPWTPELVARLNQAHMALIPTLTLFDSEARKGGASDAVRQDLVDRMVAELHAFSQAGGEVLFGTDVGYVDHFDTALEYTQMSRAGMSFAQILASLTTNPARRFGYAGRSGRIARGMDADLAVLRDDPAKDITAFSKVEFTIRGGSRTFPSK